MSNAIDYDAFKVILDGVLLGTGGGGGGTVEGLTTVESNPDKRLQPDGVGGVIWGDTPYFNRILWVGSGYRGFKDQFNTIQAAITYLNNLIAIGDPEAPSPTKRYVLWLAQEDFAVDKLVIPDWVWLKGDGIRSTGLGYTGAGNTDFLIQSGIGGLDGLGLYGIGAGTVKLGWWVRDSVSVYSGIPEPFAIVGGETLIIQQGPAGTPFTVTFQAGDTTAALVAARINAAATGNIKAVEVGTNIGGTGYVQIGCNDSNNEVIVTGSGTANTLLGIPAAGKSGIDPSTLQELLRYANDVYMLLGAPNVADVPTCGVWIDDTAWPDPHINNLQIRNLQGTTSASALRYPGGALSIESCRLIAKNSLILDEQFTSAQNNWLNLYNTVLGEEYPQAYSNVDVYFVAGLGTVEIFFHNTTYNEQKVTNISGQTLYLTQRTVPYQQDYQEQEPVVATTLAAYGATMLTTSVDHAYPGRYMCSVTTEGRGDATSPPRACLARIRNSRTGDIYGEFYFNSQYNGADYRRVTVFKEFIVPDGLGAGTDVIILEFGTSVPGQSVSMRRARAEIMRVG